MNSSALRRDKIVIVFHQDNKLLNVEDDVQVLEDHALDDIYFGGMDCETDSSSESFLEVHHKCTQLKPSS